MVLADGKGAPSISSREYRRRAQPHRRRKSGTVRQGRRARRREQPRPRRTSGKKSKNAKMAGVGVLYTLKRTDDGLEGPINKRVYATFESYRALFIWLLEEAKKRGYGTAKFSKVLFVADGADVLWDLQAEYFPDAEVCLDWYHVVEKLWKTGKTLGCSSQFDWEKQSEIDHLSRRACKVGPDPGRYLVARQISDHEAGPNGEYRSGTTRSPGSICEGPLDGRHGGTPSVRRGGGVPVDAGARVGACAGSTVPGAAGRPTSPRGLRARGQRLRDCRQRDV